mgnify:CR=1 FL=1
MSSGDFVRQFEHSRPQLPVEASLWTRLSLDFPLLFLLVLLSCFGLMVLYSGSDQNMAVVMRQARYLMVAFVAMFVLAQLDVDRIKRWSLAAYIVGVMLLLAVYFFGTGAKGAQRWLTIPGGMRFQPSEIMKLVMPMSVAWYLGRRTLPPSFKHVVGSLAIVLVPTVLILKQPDLGTSLLIAASALGSMPMGIARDCLLFGKPPAMSPHVEKTDD